MISLNRSRDYSQQSFEYRSPSYLSFNNSKRLHQWLVRLDREEYEMTNEVSMSAANLLELSTAIRHFLVIDRCWRKELKVGFIQNDPNFVFVMKKGHQLEKYDEPDIRAKHQIESSFGGGFDVEYSKYYNYPEMDNVNILEIDETRIRMKEHGVGTAIKFPDFYLTKFTFALEQEARPHCTDEEWKAHQEKNASYIEKLKELYPEAFLDSSEENS